MVDYLLIFTLSCTLSFLLTNLMIRIGHRYKIYDYPGGRKIHSVPVPTLGGIGVAAAFFILLWFGRLIHLPYLSSPAGRDYVIGLTIAGTLALLLGVYDDLKGSSPLTKIFIQIVIASILYYFGFGVKRITNPFGDFIDPLFFRLPVTIVWVLVITNAVNLIDGLDGLASGVVIFSATSMFIIMLIHGGGAGTYATLILIGTLLGFLRYNFSPAKIFLGDTGSIFLGVIWAAISISEERKGMVSITLMLPIVIMAFPLLDVLLAFIRRIRAGGNPFKADRLHLHHRLIAIGLSQKQVVLGIYLVCFYLGVMSISLSMTSKQFVMIAFALVGGAVIIAIFIGLRILRYLEYRIKENEENV